MRWRAGGFGLEMIDDTTLRNVGIYDPAERARVKADRRRADVEAVRRGEADEVQERNRRLPHASEVRFEEREVPLPKE